MAVTASERDILKVVSDFKQADRMTIGRQLGMSTEYVGFLCRSIRGMYLKELGVGLYELTPRGEAIVARMKEARKEKEVSKQDVLKLIADLKY